MKRNVWVAVLLAVTMVATAGGVQPAAAATKPPQPSPAPAASGLIGQPKVGDEVLDMRTEDSKTFVGDVPGQFVTKMGAGPLHVKDGAGKWVDINADLADPVGGRRRTKATAVPVEVATDATDPALVRVQAGDGADVAFGLSGAGKGTAGTDRSQGVLGGALPGVDVKVRPLRNGAATDLVLASPAASADYVFPLKLKGLTATVEADGSVAYRDGKGAVRATTPKGHMFDSNVAVESGDPARSDGVVYSLVVLPGGRRALKVTLDRAWLDDPTRIYPVTVDPDVIVAGIDDTYNQSPYTNNYSGEAEVKVGSFNGGGNKSRGFFHFNLAPWNGKVINSAGMYAWESHSFSCQPRPMSLYRVTTPWSAVATYPGPSLGERIAGANFAVGYSSSCGSTWAGFDVTGAVQNWTNGAWANQGLAFVADNEADTYGWKKFCSANGGAGCTSAMVPQIQVVWSNPATVPTCAPTGPTASVNPNGPVAVSWVPVPNNASCNGGSGITGYYVNYYDAAGGGGSTYCASPACAATTIPNLVRGRQYHFAIYTNNAVGFNPNPAWTGWVTITAVPGPPTGAAANAGRTSAYVWWTPPADQGTSPISQYAVWAYEPTTGAFVGSGTCAATCTALTLSTGLTLGHSYTFYVYAGNATGWSNPSATTGSVTLTNTPLPNPVLNPTAWPGDAAAYLRWTAPPDNGAAPIDAYVLGAYNPAGTLIGSIVCNLTGTTAPCPGLDWVWNGTTNPGAGLTNGTAYKWIIFARNAAGYGSATGYTDPVTPTAGSLFPPRSAMVTAGNGEAVIQWGPPPAGGAPITGYLIQRWTAGPTPVYVDYQSVLADQVGYLWSGLTNGVNYTFRVFTQSANGYSALPTPTNNVTPAGNILNRLLLPTSPVAQDQENHQSTITWAPPALAIPASLGILATTYVVRAFKDCDRTQAPAATAQANQPTAGQPTATVTGLKNGTSYCFAIEATNLLILNSGQSAPSNSVIPAGPPFAPAIGGATRGNKEVTVTWSPPPAQTDGTPGNNGREITGYRVEGVDTTTGAIVPGEDNATSPFVVRGLKNGDFYTFSVRAKNAVGTGDASGPTDPVNPAGRPYPPEEVRGTSIAPGQADVTWLPPSQRIDGTPGDNGEPITSYQVSWPGGSTVVGATTSTTVYGLTNGTGYLFTVQAINVVGISDGTTSPGPATPRATPSPPSNVRAIPRDGYAVVSWNPSADNGAQVLYNVVANPGGASQSTFSTTAMVNGLINGQEYTFTVEASNSVGTAISIPSLGVTPGSANSPTPTSPCLAPINYDEILLPSGARRTEFRAPCRPDLGKVRLGTFIAEPEVVLAGIVVADGDGRGFNQNMQPQDNRIYIEVDFSTGRGFIFVNHSCTDMTNTTCTDAQIIRGNFVSDPRDDGGIRLEYDISNSRTANTTGENTFRISGELIILPKVGTASSPQSVCVMGSLTAFPSVEGYYDHSGVTYTLFQLGESHFGAGGLKYDRSLPEC